MVAHDLSHPPRESHITSPITASPSAVTPITTPQGEAHARRVDLEPAAQRRPDPEGGRRCAPSGPKTRRPPPDPTPKEDPDARRVDLEPAAHHQTRPQAHTPLRAEGPLHTHHHI